MCSEQLTVEIFRDKSNYIIIRRYMVIKEQYCHGFGGSRTNRGSKKRLKSINLELAINFYVLLVISYTTKRGNFGF